MKNYLVIAEIGQGNEFESEVFITTTKDDADEMAEKLIAEKAEEMKFEGNPDSDDKWLLEGDGWFYRVRVEEHLVTNQ